MTPAHTTQPPFFSVVITSYNRAALLKRALKSLLQQTEKDWEAIIIDDGSTDNTTAIIHSLLKKHRQLHYRRQPPQGAVAAKNFGISLTTGQYITFLDSDDTYEPQHLADRKQTLLSHPEVDLLHGGIKVIGYAYVPDRFDYKHLIPIEDCAVGATFFIKRSLLHSLQAFKEMPLGSDADYLERAVAAGVKIWKTNAPTYIYHREGADSITRNLAKPL